MRKVKVLDLDIVAMTIGEVVQNILSWAVNAENVYAIEAADVHVVTRARKEKKFGLAMQKFDLICPDGMPVKWSVNSKLKDKIDNRISGSDLMKEVLLRGGDSSESAVEHRHFFLGGKESTLEKLLNNIKNIAPKALVVGSYSPPFGQWPDDELERICQKIKDSKANHVWVGLGCPKQEMWIADNKESLPVACYYGVGAAFDFHAGMIKRAPSLIQKFGLEWFYRLCKEPKRLWKRYFVFNSLFLYYTFKDMVKGK